MAKISANYEVVYIIDLHRVRRLLPLSWQSSRLWLNSMLPTSLLTSGASVVSLTRSTTRPKAIMS